MRIHHTQRGCRRDSRFHRIAALLQYAKPGLGGQTMRGNNHAIVGTGCGKHDVLAILMSW